MVAWGLVEFQSNKITLVTLIIVILAFSVCLSCISRVLYRINIDPGCGTIQNMAYQKLRLEEKLVELIS